MTTSVATNAHEKASDSDPNSAIQAHATTADATGIARAAVGGHEILVEGGGNFDLAPSSAEILVGALAADLVDALLLAGDRRGFAVDHARVAVETYFNAGLIGGVASDDPIGPHHFTATCEIVAPQTTTADLAAVREDAEAASALVTLLRNANRLIVATGTTPSDQTGLPRHIADRAEGLARQRSSVSNRPGSADPAFWRRPLTAEARSSVAPRVAQVLVRERFAMLIDNTGALGPTALDVATASLATCLTHTTIMHAALNGDRVESAVADIALVSPGSDASSFIGRLTLGTTATHPLAESLAGEALSHCLLVHCFGRTNTVIVKLASRAMPAR